MCALSLSLSLCSYANDRNTTEGWHRAYSYGEDEVILQFPALPYSELKDPAGINRGRIHAGETNEQHSQADTVLRNALLADKERQLTTVCFKFPVRLDNEVFSRPSARNRIDMHLIMDKPEDEDEEPIRVKIFFAIAVYDENPPRIRAPSPPASENEAADLLERQLNIGARGAGNNNGMR